MLRGALYFVLSLGPKALHNSAASCNPCLDSEEVVGVVVVAHREVEAAVGEVRIVGKQWQQQGETQVVRASPFGGHSW